MEGEANAPLHVGPPGHQVALEQKQQTRDHGIVVIADCKPGLHCQKAGKKAWCTLNQLERSAEPRKPNVLLPLPKALLRPLLE